MKRFVKYATVVGIVAMLTIVVLVFLRSRREIGVHTDEILYHAGEMGCAVRYKADLTPSPTQAVLLLDATRESVPPDKCPEPIRIELADPIDGPRPYLSVQTFTRMPHLLFDGQYLPRERWDEGERWAKEHCGSDDNITCLSWIKDGKIVRSPILDPRGGRKTTVIRTE